MKKNFEIGEFVFALDFVGKRSFVGRFAGQIAIDGGKVYAVEDELGLTVATIKEWNIKEMRPLFTFLSTLSEDKQYTLSRKISKVTEDQMTQWHIDQMRGELNDGEV